MNYATDMDELIIKTTMEVAVAPLLYSFIEEGILRKGVCVDLLLAKKHFIA